MTYYNIIFVFLLVLPCAFWCISVMSRSDTICSVWDLFWVRACGCVCEGVCGCVCVCVCVRVCVCVWERGCVCVYGVKESVWFQDCHVVWCTVVLLLCVLEYLCRLSALQTKFTLYLLLNFSLLFINIFEVRRAMDFVPGLLGAAVSHNLPPKPSGHRHFVQSFGSM